MRGGVSVVFVVVCVCVCACVCESVCVEDNSLFDFIYSLWSASGITYLA